MAKRTITVSVDINTEENKKTNKAILYNADEKVVGSAFKFRKKSPQGNGWMAVLSGTTGIGLTLDDALVDAVQTKLGMKE